MCLESFRVLMGLCPRISPIIGLIYLLGCKFSQILEHSFSIKIRVMLFLLLIQTLIPIIWSHADPERHNTIKTIEKITKSNHPNDIKKQY